MGNGYNNKLWEDVGLERRLLLINTLLYITQCNRKIFLYTVLSQNPLNLGFRSLIVGAKWVAWLNLCKHVIMVKLTNDSDRFARSLTTSGVFRMKSMYKEIMNNHSRFLQDTFVNFLLK
jgi:hypothetical protein